MNCLQRLNRTDETDKLREAVYKQHQETWRVLEAIAQSYLTANHGGYLIAGEFSRGHHRGGGRWVNSMKRDRTRALQLFVEAIQLTKENDDARAVARLHFNLASALVQHAGQANSWQLQTLTDLEELPDYDEQSYGRGDIGGAPVDADGNPIFYALPESWAAAASDGERWIWALERAVQIDPTSKSTSMSQIAQMMLSQFGVQTMQNAYWWPRTKDATSEGSILAVHTLSDSETLAKLATGIKRFELPDRYNFVKLYRELAEGESSSAKRARWQLANIYLNRRQYAKAANELRIGIERHGRDSGWQQQIDQIEKNWCRFERVEMQAAGEGASIELRFRNATSVSFTANRIDLEGLLAEIKRQLKRQPNNINWQLLDMNSLGYRIMQDGMKQFVKEEVASWTQSLEPKDNHFDTQVTISTPLQNAGAYLLTASMPDGNQSKVIVWLADMALATKHMGAKTMYFVADAETGQPVEGANIEFFGYRRNNDNRRIETRNFAENTNADGFAYLRPEEEHDHYQWIAIARRQGKLAFLGFNSIWRGSYNRQQWNQKRGFTVTDRPVYRPDQEVHFKFWLREASFERDGQRSQFAGKTFTVTIHNPKHEEVFESVLEADEFGGIEGTYPLPSDATLGQYTLGIREWSQYHLQSQPENPYGGGPQTGATFRVEEYKKPEFEVSIDAPQAPVALGEAFKAKITAKYYFGSPVTNATVKYKVLRTKHDSAWFPPTPWDWLYGPGYWWFGYDYDWYPGWRTWGCRRPTPWWFWRAPEQPEVVATAETALNDDGTLEIAIDTAIAKELHGDQDHSYQVQAEVVDESRRTIVANGRVLVARAPFKVHAWVDRGYYRVGQTINASLAARTIDGKPVSAAGRLRLMRVTYTDGKPVETEVQRWELPTDEDGTSKQQLTASEPGQYRLAYTVTDAQDRQIEGGYIFTVIGRGFDSGDFRFDDLEVIPDRREYKTR